MNKLSSYTSIAALVFALLVPQGLHAANDLLKPYEAIYQAKVKGLKVKMKRRFTPEDDQVSISMTANKLIFSIKEFSRMQVEDGLRLRAISYQHERRNLGDRHDRDLVFNWENNTVSDRLRPKQQPMAVEFPIYDKVSYQEQLRLDLLRDPSQTRFEYLTTDGEGSKVYAFDFVGEEIIDTPLGKLRTVKYKRDRGPDSERQTFIWFARDWDYLLARLDQIEGPDKKPERLLIREAQLDGLPIEPLDEAAAQSNAQ